MLDEIKEWLEKATELARQIGDMLTSLLEPAIDELADVSYTQSDGRELCLNAMDRRRANVLALQVLRQRSGRHSSGKHKARHRARNTLRTARPSPVQAGAAGQETGAALMVQRKES